MTRGKIDSIQCLRGLAAIAVMMSHSLVNITAPGQAEVARFLFLSGGSGVDLFFIISGFILVVSTAKSDGTLAYTGSFLARRMLRIWPAYVAATLLFMWVGYGGGVFLYGPAQERILKSLAFIPLDFSGDAPFFGYAALAVGWTLNYEVYFYLIAAATMLFGRLRWAAMMLWMILTLLIAPAFLSGFTFASSFRQPLTGYANIVTNPIILNFAAGVAIGLAAQHVPASLPRRFLAGLVGAAAVFAVVMLLGRYRTGHGLAFYGMAYVPLVASLAVAAKSGLEIPVPRVLIWLGAISYSIYLVHPMVQYAVPTALNALQLHHLTTGLGMAVSTALLSIGVAHLFYRGFEVWLPDQIRNLFKRVMPVDRKSAGFRKVA